MTVAFALGAFLFAVGIYFGSLREINAARRQHARERDLMLNQIMHLTGHTWTPPPAHEPPPPPVPRTTVRSPEQQPDGEFA